MSNARGSSSLSLDPQLLSDQDTSNVSGGNMRAITTIVDPFAGADIGDDVSEAGAFLTALGNATLNPFDALAGLGLQAAGSTISNFIGGLVGRH